MRYLTLSGVLIFLAALAMPAPAAAQRPGGSYQQTCRNIDVRGSSLRAECRDANGGWHRTEMSDYRRCGGDIQNINGNLECAAGGYGGGYGKDRDHDRDQDHDRDRDHDRYGNNGYGPRGSYTQTCQNITVSGNTLRASCQKKNGKYKNTSLNNYQYCRGDIQNDNGKLRCR